MKYFKNNKVVSRKSAVWGMSEEDKKRFTELENEMLKTRTVGAWFTDNLKLELQNVVFHNGQEFYFDSISEAKQFVSDNCPGEPYHFTK